MFNRRSAVYAVAWAFNALMCNLLIDGKSVSVVSAVTAARPLLIATAGNLDIASF